MKKVMNKEIQEEVKFLFGVNAHAYELQEPELFKIVNNSKGSFLCGRDFVYKLEGKEEKSL